MPPPEWKLGASCRDFIFGMMHTQVMRAFQWHQGQWLCDLDHDLYIKKSQLGFVATRGIHVAQTHLGSFVDLFYSPNDIAVG